MEDYMSSKMVDLIDASQHWAAEDHAAERAKHYKAISAKIVGHYAMVFPNYAFTDLESALDLMLAEVTTARTERDTAQTVAAEKIHEADARGAIAINCAKAMGMLVEGKVSEDVAVSILNSAETDMLRAAEWLAERDAGMLKAVEEAQKQELYWKAANEHAAKRFKEAADERDKVRAAISKIRQYADDSSDVEDRPDGEGVRPNEWMQMVTFIDGLGVV